MVYHGPREQVVPFFESLGFSLPERKGVADFLQEVCSQKDQEVRDRLACLGWRANNINSVVLCLENMTCLLE